MLLVFPITTLEDCTFVCCILDAIFITFNYIVLHVFFLDFHVIYIFLNLDPHHLVLFGAVNSLISLS